MIERINWYNIIDLLLNAQRQIILVMPAVHEEWVLVMQRNPNLANLNIRICIDNSEEVIRSGYGDFESILSLKTLGAEIMQCDNLRVQFLSVDDEAYCLFLESRILSGNPEGYNAINLDGQVADAITSQFFNTPVIQKDAQQQEPVLSEVFDEEKFTEVQESLTKNPPAEPDLQRKINTYSTLFSFAELSLEGGSPARKLVSIPKDALPFKDERLKSRLKAKANLFTKEKVSEWNELSELKEKLLTLRKEFLVSCNLRPGMSIVKSKRKAELKVRVCKLQKEAETLTNKMQDRVQTAINQSEDAFRNELYTFFQTNPPVSVANLSGENAGRKIEKEINRILDKIKFPDAASLISKIKLKDHYYDFTPDDLKDEKFEKWFVDNGLVDEGEKEKLAHFGEAYTIKRLS